MSPMKIVRRLALGAFVVAVVTVVLAFSVRAYRQSQLAADLEIDTPNGIDEQQFVQANGIEHWVTIRGTDRRNPIIFFVHGGPGEIVSFVPSATQALERDFTVVHWDQRGAGRTFERNAKPPADLSLAQMRDDGVAIVRWVTQHLDQAQVILLGHSWGSILGLNMVLAQPELFAAYVGTGQFVEWKAQVATQYDDATRRAESMADARVLAELAAFGGPPDSDLGRYQQFRALTTPYLAPSDLAFFSGQLANVWVAPRVTLGGFWNALQGARASVGALASTLITADVTSLGTQIPVPFVIVQGDSDWITPVSLAVEYFDRVVAPAKALVRIPGAGHYAFTTHQAEFLDALVSEVLPLTRGR